MRSVARNHGWSDSWCWTSLQAFNREDKPGSGEVFGHLNGVDLAYRSLQGVDGMNLFDFNAVNAISQEFSPASPYILADEWQQLLLAGVGHGLGERHIDNALLGQNAQR